MTRLPPAATSGPYVVNGRQRIPLDQRSLDPEPVRGLNLRLTVGLHDRIKAAARAMGLPMQRWAAGLLEMACDASEREQRPHAQRTTSDNDPNPYLARSHDDER